MPAQGGWLHYSVPGPSSNPCSQVLEPTVLATCGWSGRERLREYRSGHPDVVKIREMNSPV